LVQAHPTPGLGEFLNSDEIGEDGKPVKPFVPLPITQDAIKQARSLMKGHETPEATTGTGSATDKEGDQ
jgi:hypothetical protein